MVVVDMFSIHLESNLGGCWSKLTGGICSEVNSELKLLGRDLEWSLLTGGR